MQSETIDVTQVVAGLLSRNRGPDPQSPEDRAMPNYGVRASLECLLLLWMGLPFVFARWQAMGIATKAVCRQRCTRARTTPPPIVMCHRIRRLVLWHVPAQFKSPWLVCLQTNAREGISSNQYGGKCLAV